jgi:hypothetical protein
MGKLAGLPVMMVGAALWFASQAGAAEIRVAKVDVAPGSPAVINIVLATSQGEQVAGTQNDITFDPAIVSASAASVCRVNAAVSDAAPATCDDDPTPAECDCKKDPQVGPCKQLNRALDDVCSISGEVCGGTNPPCGAEDGTCTRKRFRGLILALSNTNPINNPEVEGEIVLYTCTFQVATDAVLDSRVPLECSNEGGSDADGKACGAEGAACNALGCTDGEVHVASEPTATPTATATIPPPTNTPTNTSAVTEVPTSTRTNTARPPTGDTDDDGCQVVAPVSSHVAWLLFAPAALLLWSRRRSR